MAAKRCAHCGERIQDRPEVLTLNLEIEGARIQVSWCPGHEINPEHDRLAESFHLDGETYYAALMVFRDGLERKFGAGLMPDLYHVRRDLSNPLFTLRKRDAWGRSTIR